jgi:hypothetical protein
MDYFNEMDVFITPALVVNRIVVSKVRVLTVGQTVGHLNDHLSV